MPSDSARELPPQELSMRVRSGDTFTAAILNGDVIEVVSGTISASTGNLNPEKEVNDARLNDAV